MHDFSAFSCQERCEECFNAIRVQAVLDHGVHNLCSKEQELGTTLHLSKKSCVGCIVPPQVTRTPCIWCLNSSKIVAQLHSHAYPILQLQVRGTLYITVLIYNSAAPFAIKVVLADTGSVFTIYVLFFLFFFSLVDTHCTGAVN